MAPPVYLPRAPEDSISVTINGTKYQVPSSFSAVSLNDYLRTHLHLTGTKVMCREGGCGVCTVHVAYPDPTGSGEIVQRSINSCLCPILSCDGWEITTVEGVGTQKTPHPIQKAMTDFYATQCGFCTPGWVMSMYSLLQEHPERETLTKKLIEESLDGNICRCTGYRPILDAMKTFGAPEIACGTSPAVDMEDMNLKLRLCLKTGSKCAGTCRSHTVTKAKPLPDSISDAAPPWYKPTTLDALYSLIAGFSKDQKVYYLVGHTGIGVYNDAPYDSYVDLKGIPDFFLHTKTADKLSVGAGMSLTNLIRLFREEAKNAGFEYLAELAGTISKTAHTSVRNIGSWGGNLALKHQHPEFPSDSYTCFTAAGARIFVGGPEEKDYSMEDFLKTNMTKKIIMRLELKSCDKSYVTKCFKIMPRKQNAHGYVNAGLRLKVDNSQPGSFKVSETPVLAFGNINKNFVRATKTEQFLTGADLADSEKLQAALKCLNDELEPEAKEDESSPEYRRSLAVSLFYKTVLEIVGDVADARYKTAIGGLVRPLTQAAQSFQTKQENWPVTKAMPKLESMIQCTGEAKYIADIDEQNMLHAAFALSDHGNAGIYKIEPKDTLLVPGVLKIFTAGDIPGENNFAADDAHPELILASGRVNYAGQPIAIVIAETRDAAEEGAKRLQVQYFDIRTPIITCQDAIREKSFHGKPTELTQGDYDKATVGAPMKISGNVDLGGQVHFHMETQVAVAYPTEDGLDVQAGTQWIDHAQEAIHRVCGIPQNSVNISVRRNGGGFGGKITRNNLISTAVALSAFLIRRPVKMHMSLWDNSKAVGKRISNHMEYEAGFDQSGKLIGIKMDIYANQGNQSGGNPPTGMARWLDSAYNCPAWKITWNGCKTNIPANTSCRAPGSTEAIYFIETVMEHVALTVGKPSLEVKQLNYYKNGDKVLDGSTLNDPVRIQQITDKLVIDCGFSDRQREIADFNAANRWKKRGLAFVPQRWATGWKNHHFNCLIAIYHSDGTIAVTHGGIEIGQGINTKVAQVIAYELGVDMKYIKIQPTASITNANGTTTGGSVTSEIVCMAAISACRELKTRIDPVQKASPGNTWEQTIAECFKQQIDLTGRAWVAPTHTDNSLYSTYGAMCTEVELDILTGEYQVRRVDVLYDCGESMSPFVDIGQIEGAIIMGLGYYTSEEILYEKSTGKNLSFGTWKYKPPMANDIPVDLRVELLHDAPNPSGVLRSKIVAEPPLCMACSVVFALRDAIRANIAETGTQPGWFQLVAPMTVERVQQYCKIDLKQLRFRD